MWNSLQFEKVFAISLPSRTDHRDALDLAASFTGLRVNIIDGVLGKDVADKALPPGALKWNPSDGNKGSWRAHMNAIQQYGLASIFLFLKLS
jgi:hypothetical protein